VLRKPDGRVHFAGDYMSEMSSFMQGAFESARETAAAVHARASEPASSPTAF
jgi:monoamine oxidase